MAGLGEPHDEPLVCLSTDSVRELLLGPREQLLDSVVPSQCNRKHHKLPQDFCNGCKLYDSLFYFVSITSASYT